MTKIAIVTKTAAKAALTAAALTVKNPKIVNIEVAAASTTPPTTADPSAKAQTK